MYYTNNNSVSVDLQYDALSRGHNKFRMFIRCTVIDRYCNKFNTFKRDTEYNNEVGRHGDN